MKKLILSFGLVVFTTLAVKAQSFLAPNNTREFTPYQSSVDLKLYERVITEKQKTYDYNLEKLGELLKDKEYYLQDLKEVDNESYLHWNKSFNEYWSKVRQANPDLSDNSTFNTLKDSIKWFTTQIKNAIREAR